MPKNPALQEQYLKKNIIAESIDTIIDSFYEKLDYMAWCTLNPINSQQWEFCTSSYLPENGIKDEDIEKLKLFISGFEKKYNGQLEKRYGQVTIVIRKIENIYQKDNGYSFQNMEFIKTHYNSKVLGFKLDFALYINEYAYIDYKDFKLDILKKQYNMLERHIYEVVGKENFYESIFKKKENR